MKTNLLRNTFATIAALFISMFALPQTAQAEDYDISIAGEQVTSANCHDLSVIDGVSGTVKYNPATKTLTLDNATINATGEGRSGISGGIDGLTVQVKGTVNVTAESSYALVFYKSATLTGGGTLNAMGGNCGILVNNTDLTIDGCTVNAKGTRGFMGWYGDVESLTIRNATVTAEGNEYGSICDFKDITLDGCAITQPAGAAFVASLGGVALNGELVTEKVVIEPVIEKYDLEIAGVQVTSANCSDLTVIDGVSGTVKYNPYTKTLTLDNATINATVEGKSGIYGKIDGLTVEVKGTVNVTTRSTALEFHKSATLTGDGTLNATSSDNGGSSIYAETDLTIDGLTVNAKGEWGITGYDGSVERLTIRNATVTAEGNGTEGSICDFKDITLEGCAITQPAGAAFDESLKGVALNGKIVKEKVTISLLSASGFTVIDGVKKPVLSHGYIDIGNDNFSICLYLSDNRKDFIMIQANKKLHTGKDIDLTKKETKHEGQDCWCVAYMTDFISWEDYHGVFYGYGHPDNGSPVFTTGTLRIDGDPAGMFTVSLKNGRITADTKTGDGKTHTVSIKYGNDPTGIDTVTADVSAKKQGTYNLQGVKLNTAFDRLPAGIYIVDGKKVVKR